MRDGTKGFEDHWERGWREKRRSVVGYDGGVFGGREVSGTWGGRWRASSVDELVSDGGE